MHRFGSAASCALVVCALVACNTPPLTTPGVVTTRTVRFSAKQTVQDKIDILFMVDDSGSMEAMSKELRDRFPQFFKAFSDLATQGTNADLHVGVVTSDYGAGNGVDTSCDASPGGKRGRLQALGAAKAAGCKPPVGVNFVQFKFDGENNLPAGQDLEQTFACMAAVGSSGCGFEHPLESVYAALHDGLAENQGFLREDAILAVVFLTNEDDSSAPPGTDLFNGRLVTRYGFEDSYRSTRFGIVCGDPPVPPPYGDSVGPLADCRPASNPGGLGPGLEYDVDRYIDFFRSPSVAGGVKDDPQDVVLVGIDAQEFPVQTILANPALNAEQRYTPCPALNETSTPACVPVLQHSCQNAADPGFFGDPAVRLNAVIGAVANHAFSSICDSDYTGAMQTVADLIISKIGEGCIPGSLPRDEAGDPIADCSVEDVSSSTGVADVVVLVPRCDQADGVIPCWRAEIKDSCRCRTEACVGGSPDSLGITIDRGGMPAPAHTVARVSCDTLTN